MDHISNDNNMKMIGKMKDVKESITYGQVDNKPLALVPTDKKLPVTPLTEGEHDSDDGAYKAGYYTHQCWNMKVVERAVRYTVYRDIIPTS